MPIGDYPDVPMQTARNDIFRYNQGLEPGIFQAPQGATVPIQLPTVPPAPQTTGIASGYSQGTAEADIRMLIDQHQASLARAGRQNADVDNPHAYFTAIMRGMVRIFDDNGRILARLRTIDEAIDNIRGYIMHGNQGVQGELAQAGLQAHMVQEQALRNAQQAMEAALQGQVGRPNNAQTRARIGDALMDQLHGLATRAQAAQAVGYNNPPPIPEPQEQPQDGQSDASDYMRRMMRMAGRTERAFPSTPVPDATPQPDPDNRNIQPNL